MGDMIITKNLSLKLAKHQILDNITFKVQRGEIFGMLGPSGAGKTTLIKILTGQMQQDSGYAELLGRDTKKLTALEHKQIGTMMESFGLYDRLSVYDNLCFYAEIYHVPRNSVDHILKRIHLYENRRTAVSKLSKGMKSRLSLARALMNHAKILFLDEPTSGLDPVTTREIHCILAEQREKGTTIFLTTHNMYEAEYLCDHVALLNKGSIVEYGVPMNICKKYDHLNKLRITLKNGEMTILENSAASALLVKEYLEENRIEAIHSTEPTLENVFIKLTGKELGGYE